MLRRQEAMGEKAISAIDRVRRALPGTSATITGISCRVNRTWKYSNRAQRYLTCCRNVTKSKISSGKIKIWVVQSSKNRK